MKMYHQIETLPSLSLPIWSGTISIAILERISKLPIQPDVGRLIPRLTTTSLSHPTSDTISTTATNAKVSLDHQIVLSWREEQLRMVMRGFNRTRKLWHLLRGGKIPCFEIE